MTVGSPPAAVSPGAWCGSVCQGIFELCPGGSGDDVASRRGLVAVFSGQLYNQTELVRELATTSSPVDSPAQLVLEGYGEWGDGMISKLDGVFAWALWDERRERLIAARDALGLHPFYYAHVGQNMVFSWDLHTLRRHPSVSGALNRAWLAEMLCGRFLDPAETALAAVRRLLGGHALTFAEGALHIFRYWDPLPAGRPIAWASDEEVAEFPAVLGRAVERAMQLGPSGILLSGGLDSISIAAAACDVA